MLTEELPSPQAVRCHANKDPCREREVNDLIESMVEYRPEDRPSLPELLSVVMRLGLPALRSDAPL